MIPQPGLYTGTLRHRRFRPRPHEFSYDLFMAWLDIDRIPETMSMSAWTSCNRFNWAAFDDRDHLGDSSRPLRYRVLDNACAHGIEVPNGPIYLLTHLRYLGYCFNPISFFYCYDREGALHAVLAEVNNTFGERRTYWLRGLRHRCEKTMHVSPFMPMELEYEFALNNPSTSLVAHMATREHGEAANSAPCFDATLTLTHQPWSARTIRTALIRHPFMTAKVIAAIHWQALRLYLKRLPVFTHPDRLDRHVPRAQKS